VTRVEKDLPPPPSPGGSGPADPGVVCMIRVERILVPIDFSSVSRASSLYAVDLARVFNAEIIFFHVLATSSFSSRLLFPETDASAADAKRLTDAERVHCRHSLDEFLSGLPLSGIRHSVQLEKGIPFLRILHMARRCDPSVLIMGTHGATGLEHVIIGGTAERVIRKAGCPVLTIKPEGFETFFRKILDGARFFESRGKDTQGPQKAYRFPPRKVLYPTDFSEVSRLAMDYAVFVARKANAELILLHAASPEDLALRTEESTDGAAGPGRPEVEERMEDLVKEIGAFFENLRVSARIATSRPASAILKTTIEEGVDTIVMGTHGWTSLGLLLSTRTTDRVIRDAPCPVLTIRPNWKLEEVEARFRKVYKKLSPIELQKISAEHQAIFESEALADPDGIKKSDLFMKYYSKEGIATAFEEYGIFATLRNKGFDDFLITFDLDDPFRQGMRVYCGGKEDPSHLLIDLILRQGTLQCRDEEKEVHGPEPHLNCPLLIIEWLCLQNPRAQFSPQRPPLPGQVYPGLGIGYEMMEFLILMAERLKACGVANTPQYFHTAAWYREKFTFYNPVREGRLVAMIRDTADYNPTDVSWAVHLGCLWDVVTGEKVVWQGGNQIYPLSEDLKRYFSSPEYRIIVRDTIANSRFRIDWKLFRKRMRSGASP
jgi:nucleotide-binding universal stress UspA family protein